MRIREIRLLSGLAENTRPRPGGQGQQRVKNTKRKIRSQKHAGHTEKGKPIPPLIQNNPHQSHAKCKKREMIAAVPRLPANKRTEQNKRTGETKHVQMQSSVPDSCAEEKQTRQCKQN